MKQKPEAETTTFQYLVQQLTADANANAQRTNGSQKKSSTRDSRHTLNDGNSGYSLYTIRDSVPSGAGAAFYSGSELMLHRFSTSEGPRFFRRRSHLSAASDIFEIDRFRELGRWQRIKYLNRIKVNELVSALTNIVEELRIVQLENHYLKDFLETNDPKVYNMLAEKHFQQERSITGALGSGSLSNRRSSKFLHGSTYSMTSSEKKFLASCNINYRARNDLITETIGAVQKSINEIKLYTKKKFKQLYSCIEELQFTIKEVTETERSFLDNFVDNDDIVGETTIEEETEKAVERRFALFIKDWNRCAAILCENMILFNSTTNAECITMQTNLTMKKDMVGSIGAIDCEQLMIERDALRKRFLQQNIESRGIRQMHGMVTLRLAEGKRKVAQLDERSLKYAKIIDSTNRKIKLLTAEISKSEHSNQREKAGLHEMVEDNKRFSAPSVEEYFHTKKELIATEKEYKSLRRKVFILKMTLGNLLKKSRLSQSSIYN